MSIIIKKILISFLLSTISHLLLCQNLVLNGSFEEYLSCPNSAGQINRAKYWFSANDGDGGSSEYFNACNNPGFCGVPDNGFGDQNAKTGAAYAGCSCFEIDNEYREYIEGSLKNALIAGKDYCIEYYVSLSEASGYAINSLGLFFTQDSLITFSSQVYDTIPQIENTMIVIVDSVSWVKVSGTYIAIGGESFFTLGNFRTIFQTNSILLSSSPNYSYYFFDDISVWPCDAPIYVADAGGDRTICVGQNVELGTNQLEEYHYKWFDKDSVLLDSSGYLIVSPDTTTTYYLWVLDFKYDQSWDTVTVFVDEICDSVNNENVVFLSNIFSPNGDGINDVFLVRAEKVIALNMKVYDRWGNMLFETSDINLGWDGRYKDHDCTEGVYFYVASVTFDNREQVEKKGTLTLVR